MPKSNYLMTQKFNKKVTRNLVPDSKDSGKTYKPNKFIPLTRFLKTQSERDLKGTGRHMFLESHKIRINHDDNVS